MRLLVDTNVYLELFLNRESRDAVINFFNLVIINSHQTFITSISLRDIGYVVHRYTHDANKSRAAQISAYTMSTKVISISNDSAISSLYSDMKDYEDSLQVSAAEESMCDAIVTFNKKDFKGCNLAIFTPQEICIYLERLHKQA